MARSTNEVKQEYTNVVLKAGSLQYEILAKQNDLKLVNDRLKELNEEYIHASNLESEVAKKLAEAAKDAPAEAKAEEEQPKQEQ